MSKSRTKEFLVRMNKECYEWLSLEAKKRDRSMAWMVNESVRQWMNRVETRREFKRIQAKGK